MSNLHHWERFGDVGRWTVPGGWVYIDLSESGSPAAFVPAPPRFVALERYEDFGDDAMILVDPSKVMALHSNHDGKATFVDFGECANDEWLSGYVVKGSPAKVAARLGLEVVK